MKQVSIIIICLLTMLFAVVANGKKLLDSKDHKNFDLLFQQSEVFLDNIDLILTDYNDEIDRLLPKTKQWLEETEHKFHELDYLFVLNEINIFRQGFIYKEINDLFQEVERTIVSFDTNLEDTNDILVMVAELKKRLRKTPHCSPGDVKKKEILREKLSLVEKLMNERVTKLEQERVDYFRVYTLIKARTDALQQMLNDDYREMLFTRSPGVVDIYFWKFIMIPVFDLWFRNLSRTIYLQMPTAREEWVIITLISFFISLPLYFVIKRYCRKKYTAVFQENPYSRKLLHYALIFFLINITVLIFHWFISPREYQLIEIVRLSFQALFFIYLSWGLKSFITKSTLSIPFMPMYGVFLFGMIMRVTAAEFCVVAVLMPLIALFCIIRLIKKTKMGYPSFERGVIWAGILAYSVIMLLSIFGFGYLALFLSFIWFTFCCVLQIGVSITLFYERSMKTQIHSHKFGGILLLALVVPLLWIFLVCRFIFYLSDFFYMDHFLYKYINYQVSVYGMSVSLMEIFIAMIVFVLFRGIILTIKYFYKYLSDDMSEFQHSIVTIANYLVWGIYILLILNLLDINYTSILVVLGGMSVGIGFGLQHIVNNFFCGLILLFGKDLRPGDTVEINGVWAYVLKVNFRSTIIKTFENAIITMPNASVIENDFKNWTLNSPVARRDIKMGVAYGSNVQQVKELLLEVAEENEHVLKKPAPSVLFTDFGDSALAFVLRFWIDDIERNFVTQSELREAIDQQFRAHGVTIAFPQLDVHLNSKRAVDNDVSQAFPACGK